MRKTVLSILGLGLLTSPIQADVTIIRSLKMTAPSVDGQVEARGTLQIKGDTLRRETHVQADGKMMDEFPYIPLTVTLISLQKGDVQRYDFNQNRFHKFSLAKWRSYIETQQAESSRITRSPFQISQSWSRVLPDQETKTIRNQNCTQFVYEWRFTAEDPETYAKKEYAVKTTLWLTTIAGPLKTTLQEEAAFKNRYYQKMKQAPLEELNGLTLQYAERMTGIEKHTLYKAITEGTTHLKKITGYPIETQTEWFVVTPKTRKPLFTIVSELEALSWTPLADAVFEPAVRYSESDTTAQLLSQGPTIKNPQQSRGF